MFQVSAFQVDAFQHVGEAIAPPAADVHQYKDGRALRRKTLPYGWWAEVEKPAEEIAQAEAAIAEARAEVKASGEVQPSTLKQLDTALWFADVETALTSLEAADTKRQAQAQLNAMARELERRKQELEDQQDEEEAIALLFTNTI